MKKAKSISYRWAFVCSCLIIISLVSGAQAADVTDSVQVNESNAFYNRRTGDYSFDAVLENISSDNFPAPIIAVIANLSSGQVAVSNADGTDSSGDPYFDYSTLIGDDNILSAGEISAAKKWIFHNPNRVRYTYDVKIIAGPTDDVAPSISITNPIDNATITSVIPYVTIEFSDEGSGVNLSTCNIEINGTDSTGLFTITDNRATFQVTTPLPSGSNVISASISDNAGNTSTAVSNFTVGSSTEPVRYIFSVSNNDWIFASPGDGTCVEYLSRENLGLLSFSDVVALSKVTPDGNVFFTLSGQGGILQSPADGSNSVYLDNSQLGLGGEDQVCAEHTGFDGSAFFAIDGQPDVYESAGLNTNSPFVQNSQLGLGDDIQVGCLHIGYDGKVYFCCSDQSGIFESDRDGTNTQFLTVANLGVPGSTIDAFAILPETVPPVITITNPGDGAFLYTTTPNITISYSDAESGIDTGSFYAEINGTDMTSAFTVTDTEATYQVPEASPLPVDGNTLFVRIRDQVGNEAGATSKFTIGILRAIPWASPTSGYAPLTVYFTTDGKDPGGTIEVFRWDFDGNGSWDTYDTVATDYTHTYYTPDTYNATLLVQSSTGETATANITITVENNPPVGTADVVPSNGEVPLDVAFYGSGSDPDGSIVLYEWDFDGDGTYDWSSTTSGNTTYTYNTVGTYQSVFRVTDDAGLTATAIAYTTVIEANPPGSPTAVAAAAPTEGQAPLTVSFNGTGTDPDNDIVLYEWDFDGDGTFDWSSPSSGSATHTYTEAGLHVARFRVTDSTGLTGSDQIGIYVTLNVSLAVTNDTAGIIVDTINLTAMDGVAVTASSTYEYCYTYYPVTNLHDGYEYSYWMSAPGDTPNQGADTFVETTFANPRVVTQVNMKGGNYYQYYGITRARLEFFDDADNLIHSTEEDLPQDAQISVGMLENVSRFRLTALVANDGGGAYDQVSIGEIEILDDKSFTAAASSSYSTYYSVYNLFDPNEAWYSAIEDHPDAGTIPWVEVTFTAEHKVSRIIIDQTWNYYYRGIIRANLELLDASGSSLYAVEHDLLSDYETIDLADIENVRSVKITVLAANNLYGDNIVHMTNLDILTNIDGQYVSLVGKADQGTYTASSVWEECYTYYPVSNLIDGQSETYWLSAQNDTPNNGVYPFVEITFPSPQMVSQITISGGSWYSYYGITRARIELLDANDAVLYSGEHDLAALAEITIPDVNDVTKCRLTALESYGYYDEYCSWDEITVYQKLTDPEPMTTDVVTTLSADTTVSVYIKDSGGNIIRTLVDNEFREQGSYPDNWDLNDNNGFRTADGLYYAVLEYVDANGQVTTYDLTHSTGGTRNHFPIGYGCDMRRGDWTETFSPFDDEQVAFTFELCSAQEVTAFIGPLWTGTDEARIRTIINRKPFPAGTHTIYWDGLDDNGNIAEPPPGDDLITGFWRYDLPDNAIFVTGGSPEITNISADPNYFSPFSEKCDENGRGEGIVVDYSVTEDVASVELRVYSIETGSLLRTIVVNNVPAGENTVFWDGKNNSGEYVDIGDYRVGLMATDAQGNQSMFRYSLVRVDY